MTEPVSKDLIEKLKNWKELDFHADRQLADEVLIADGWRVIPDEGFQGGFRWEFGTNPTYCSSEKSRPHVIHDLNTAIGVIPFGCNWRLTRIGDQFIAHVWKCGEIFRDEFEGHSTRETIAVLIAALRFKESQTQVENGAGL